MIFAKRRARAALRKEVLEIWPEGGPFTRFELLRDRNDRQLFLADGAAGQVLGNLFRTSNPIASVLNHESAYRSVFEKLGASRVPAIVHPDPKAGLLIISRPQGLDVGTILARRPKGGPDTETAIRLSAGWLRKLHDAVVKSPSKIGIDNILNRHAAWTAEGPIKAEIFRLGAELPNLFFHQTMYHGDFSARNVFIHGEDVMAIDLRRGLIRPPQLDVARFIRTVSGHRLSRPFDGPVTGIGVPMEVTEAFDSGYRRAVAQDDLTKLQIMIEMAQFDHEIAPMSRIEIARRARRNPMFKGQVRLLGLMKDALTK